MEGLVAVEDLFRLGGMLKSCSGFFRVTYVRPEDK